MHSQLKECNAITICNPPKSTTQKEDERTCLLHFQSKFHIFWHRGIVQSNSTENPKNIKSLIDDENNDKFTKNLL